MFYTILIILDKIVLAHEAADTDRYLLYPDAKDFQQAFQIVRDRFEDFGFAAGLRYEVIEDHLHATLCYTHFINVPRDNAGKSETALAAESFNLAPDAGGHYAETMGLINATVEVGF